MIEGVTKTGFKYKYDERVKQDYELLEAAARFDRAKEQMARITALDDVMNILLGDNKEALKQHIKEKNDGFCVAEKLVEEVFEIIGESEDLKNSSSSLE